MSQETNVSSEKIVPLQGVVLLENLPEDTTSKTSNIILVKNESNPMKLAQVYALPQNYEGVLKIGSKVYYHEQTADPIDWVPSLHAVMEDDIIALLQHD